ncbi:MAG: single-stranded DNA-binding protein [Methylococcaceae bacterium]
MIDALISGKLIKDPATKTGPSGKPFTQFLLSCHIGEESPVIVAGICFAEVAGRVALLKKGDSLVVVGSLKPSEWVDKVTNEIKHGLSITANNALSVYDIKKRKPQTEAAQPAKQQEFYSDELTF